jgi:hypothetical protein
VGRAVVAGKSIARVNLLNLPDLSVSSTRRRAMR